MTVSITISKITYTGTGSVSVYAYPFKCFVSSDLVVKEVLISTGAKTTLTLTTDYTVSGVGDANGGNVTLVAGNLPATKKLTIQRILPLTQTFDLVENDPAPSLSFENAYDRLVMIAQQLQVGVADEPTKISNAAGDTSFDTEKVADDKTARISAGGSAVMVATATDILLYIDGNLRMQM